MVILLTQPATSDQIKEAAQDLNGYIKFVVDTVRQVVTIGGLRHFEGEQLLLTNGSHQADLWGGGFDTLSKETDFDSMINIRPPQNSSREVLDLTLRQKIEVIIKKFLPL